MSLKRSFAKARRAQKFGTTRFRVETQKLKEDVAKSKWETLIAIVKSVAPVLGVTLSKALYVGFIAFIAVLAVQSVSRRQIVVKPIGVSKAVAEAGTSADVATRRFAEALSAIFESAQSSKQAEARLPTADEPEISVPIVGMNLSSLRQAIRNFFGLSDYSIDGEILCAHPDCKPAGQIFRIRVRTDKLATFSFDTPNQILAQHDFETAAEFAIETIDKFWAAIHWVEKNNLPRAETLANKLLIAGNVSDRAWANALLCNIKRRQKDPWAAQNFCDLSLGVRGNHLAYAHNSKGSLFLVMNRYQKAEAEYFAAIGIKEGYANAIFNHCYTTYELQRRSPKPDYAPVLSECKKALTLDPNNASYHYSIADVQESAGDIMAAISSLENVVILSPVDPESKNIRRQITRLREKLAPDSHR